MKIGILTFHRAHNYGAVLQCYALQTYLNYCGHDTVVIDYVLDDLLNCYKYFERRRFLRWNVFAILKEFYLLYPRKQRYLKFEYFISKYLKKASIESINSNPFDYIIVGSDQVWNDKLTKGFDNYYWGNFPHPSQTKIISYAASLETLWDKTMKGTVASLLKNFYSISVRESKVRDYLCAIMPEIKVQTVVDPTLLLHPKQWESLAIMPKIKEHYVFYYQVRKSSVGIEYARRVSKKKNVRLIVLSADVELDNSNLCIAASPREFLGWIKYADYVVSSSFHGTVFSLVFNKQFVSISNKTADDRVFNLLNGLGLEKHIINSEDVEILEERYVIHDKLDDYVKSSVMYLDSILK